MEGAGKDAMKRLIVQAVDALSVIGVLVLLVGGLVGGYQAGGGPGAIGGLLAAFVASIVIFGALFIFLEMNQALRDIRRLLESGAGARGSGP
jgi:hypothetical protein